MDAGTIAVTLNGATRQIRSGSTVADLLTLLQMDRSRVAVERNRDVVPKQQYDLVTLAAGDHIEVVGFVGGG